MTHVNMHIINVINFHTLSQIGNVLNYSDFFLQLSEKDV